MSSNIKGLQNTTLTTTRQDPVVSGDGDFKGFHLINGDRIAAERASKSPAGLRNSTSGSPGGPNGGGGSTTAVAFESEKLGHGDPTILGQFVLAARANHENKLLNSAASPSPDGNPSSGSRTSQDFAKKPNDKNSVLSTLPSKQQLIDGSKHDEATAKIIGSASAGILNQAYSMLGSQKNVANHGLAQAGFNNIVAMLIAQQGLEGRVKASAVDAHSVAHAFHGGDVNQVSAVDVKTYHSLQSEVAKTLGHNKPADVSADEVLSFVKLRRPQVAQVINAEAASIKPMDIVHHSIAQRLAISDAGPDKGFITNSDLQNYMAIAARKDDFLSKMRDVSHFNSQIGQLFLTLASKAMPEKNIHIYTLPHEAYPELAIGNSKFSIDPSKLTLTGHENPGKNRNNILYVEAKDGEGRTVGHYMKLSNDLMTVTNVPSDGSCFFHAIGENPAIGRGKLASELDKNFEEYIPTFANGDVD